MEPKPIHPSSSRAFQRHQEHDLKNPCSVDLITTKQNKLRSTKEGSLFCFVCTYEIDQAEMLQIAFLVPLESSRGEGVHQLGSMMTFGLAVQKFLNIE